MYDTIRALRRGEVVDIGGIKFKMDVDENGKEKEIKEGDLYIAERNTGPHLLTARQVVYFVEEGKKMPDFIHPTTNHYSFNACHCVKVAEAV